MHENPVGKELLDREHRFWDAIKNRDATTAASLSDDPSLVVGAQGIGQLDRKALGAMLQNASYELTDYDLDDLHVRPLADGVVAVAYRVDEKVVVDGKKIALAAFDSSVWVRRGDDWVCALHTESLAGDPFGRK